MMVRVDGRIYRGAAVDVHGVDPRRLRRAVRGTGSASIAVHAPDPSPVHEHLAALAGDRSLAVGPALAAAARTRGMAAPQEEELSRIRERLAEFDPPEDDRNREAVRRRAANAGRTEDELHEQVAELRGRVRTLRERGEDASDAERRLRSTAADFADARTRRIAVQERLDRLERRARSTRDRREQRLRWADRRDNLRRSAREHLVARAWDRFRSAVTTVPGDATVEETPGTYDGDDRTAALAVARVADISAPVVLAGGRFPDARSAANCLGAPVIRVRT